MASAISPASLKTDHRGYKGLTYYMTWRQISNNQDKKGVTKYLFNLRPFPEKLKDYAIALAKA
jgi:hypothetical protein